MEKVFETERLILREFMLSDASFFYNLNADPEVIKYTGDAAFISLEDAKAFLKNYSDYQRNGFGRWAVISKDTGRFIGWCGLKLNEENLVDIGFRFFKSEWGKGYASEAAKKTLEFGFKNLHLNEIIGRASFENIASIRVLEKLKMTYWKIGDCEGIQNSIYYRLTKKQFSSK